MRDSQRVRSRLHRHSWTAPGWLILLLSLSTVMLPGCMAVPTPAPVHNPTPATEKATPPTALARLEPRPGSSAPRTFRVVDGNGAPIPGAGVLVNGECAGVTDKDGVLQHDAADGDKVIAIRATAAQASARHGPNLAWGSEHDLPSCFAPPPAAACTGMGCAYQAFDTSLDWAAVGAATEASATAITATRDVSLTVDSKRPSARPLIIFNLVVSIEWAAGEAYMGQVAEALRSAARYIWDYTDGQMMVGAATIYDDRQEWTAADIRIRGDNTTCPRASIGGIDAAAWQVPVAITLGPHWTQKGPNADDGAWNRADGYETIAHEFAHYALGLYDEYVRSGDQDSEVAYCTTPTPFPNNKATHASVMDRQYLASELDDLSQNWSAGCERTWQYQASGGKAAWQAVQERFAKSPISVTMRTPTDSGGVNAGPEIQPFTLLPVVQLQPRTIPTIPVSLTVPAQGSFRVRLEWCDDAGQKRDLALGQAGAGETLAILGARPDAWLRVENERDPSYLCATWLRDNPPGPSGVVALRAPLPCDPSSGWDRPPDNLCDMSSPFSSAHEEEVLANVTAILAGRTPDGPARRSLSQHGYRRAPYSDAFVNTLVSADGLVSLYFNEPPPGGGDVGITVLLVPDSLRSQLWGKERVPNGRLYLIDGELPIGSADVQLQSICPPRGAAAHSYVYQILAVREEMPQPRWELMEAGDHVFPQEGYHMLQLKAPGVFFVATQP